MHSMTTLAHSRFRYQGALSQACVDLSRKYNDGSGIGCMPLRAGPGAHRCDVGALARDYGLAYMDVGEGREQGAEAFPAHAALQ